MTPPATSVIVRVVAPFAGLAILLASCGSDADTGAEPTVATTTTATPTSQPTSITTSTAPDPEPTATATPAATVEPTPTATPTPTQAPPGLIEVEYADGGVVGGVSRAKVSAGEAVELHVVADVVDEVHVHGYDVFGPVAPRAPAVLQFPADIPGVWEVELEGIGALLVELEVS
jgi:hypothetical protein